MGQNQSRGNSKTSVKPGKTNPLAKTLAFTNKSMKLVQIMNLFQWEEEIPNVQSQGYVFVDRIFDVKNNFSKALRFSASFIYKDSSTTLKVKIVEGGDLLSGKVIINLTYSYNGVTGHFQSGVSFFMSFIHPDQHLSTSTYISNTTLSTYLVKKYIQKPPLLCFHTF